MQRLQTRLVLIAAIAATAALSACKDDKASSPSSGKVLSGLARRINRELETANIGSPEDVDAALAAL